MKKLILLVVPENELDLGCWVRNPTAWPYVEQAAFEEAADAYGHYEDCSACNGAGYFFAEWTADELAQEIAAIARDEGSDAIISPILLAPMKPTVLVTIDDQQTEAGVESTLLVEPIVASPAVNTAVGAFAADYGTMTETRFDGSLQVAGLQGAGDWGLETLVADLQAAGAQVVVQIIETKGVADVD